MKSCDVRRRRIPKRPARARKGRPPNVSRIPAARYRRSISVSTARTSHGASTKSQPAVVRAACRKAHSGNPGAGGKLRDELARLPGGRFQPLGIGSGFPAACQARFLRLTPGRTPRPGQDNNWPGSRFPGTVPESSVVLMD